MPAMTPCAACGKLAVHITDRQRDEGCPVYCSPECAGQSDAREEAMSVFEDDVRDVCFFDLGWSAGFHGSSSEEWKQNGISELERSIGPLTCEQIEDWLRGANRGYADRLGLEADRAAQEAAERAEWERRLANGMDPFASVESVPPDDMTDTSVPW